MNPVVGSHHRLPGPQWHTRIVINPAVGCHYFPPGPRLPSQPSGITALRPVQSYTAWWQGHIGVRNLPRVFTPWRPAETRTHDLLIASPTPYRNTTTPPHSGQYHSRNYTTWWPKHMCAVQWHQFQVECQKAKRWLYLCVNRKRNILTQNSSHILW